MKWLYKWWHGLNVKKQNQPAVIGAVAAVAVTLISGIFLIVVSVIQVFSKP